MAAEILSEFPSKFDGPLPSFSADGIFPPGDFAPTHEEFRARFVETGDKDRRQLVKLLLGALMKFDYYCDAYPIYSLPPRHPLYQQVTGKAIRYWTKWFGHTRSLTPKGRVWATTGGLR